MCNLIVLYLDWTNLVDWLTRNIKGKSLAATISKLVFTCSVYCIWTERNCRIFKGLTSTEVAVQAKIRSLVRNRILSISSFKEEVTNAWFLVKSSLTNSVLKLG
ncbi:hypothetical protein ACSBR2_011834 [Camellia fascicularis]